MQTRFNFAILRSKHWQIFYFLKEFNKNGVITSSSFYKIEITETGNFTCKTIKKALHIANMEFTAFSDTGSLASNPLASQFPVAYGL